MKRIFALALAVVLCLGAFAPMANASAESNPVPMAKLGVVYITSGIYFSGGRLQTYDPEGYYYRGSGFGIGRAGTDAQYFVTNNHVVCDEDNNVYDHVYLCIDGSDIRDESTMIKCEIVARDPVVDYAIIKAPAPVGGIRPLPLLPAETMEAGDPIYVMGYPGAADNGFTGDNNYTLKDMSITDGIISRFVETVDGVNRIAHTAQTAGGNSGGPIINEYGEVIGVHASGVTSGVDKRNYGLYIDYVIAALDELGIDYELGTGAPKNSSSGNPTTGTQAPADDKNDDDGKDEDEEKDDNTLIYIGAGVMVLAAVVLIAMALRKPNGGSGNGGSGNGRSGGNAGNAGYGGNAGNVAASRPVDTYSLHVLSGPLQGRSWAVTGTVRVGRDPSGTVVYPQETRGMSRNHCRVDLMNGSVYVTDLGSTYGTFVNGQKLTPNQPVRIQKNTVIGLGGESVKLILR